MTQGRLVKSFRSVRSAAVAGVIYAILAIAALVLLRGLPAAGESGTTPTVWIADPLNQARLIVGLNLASISSVAFLWFVAVIRKRMGDREDKFFSTVFLGSALVYIGIWLVAAAAIASIAVAYQRFDDASLSTDSVTFLLGFSEALILVVGPRLQGVFVLSMSTLILRTEMLPSWLAYLGYAAGSIMVVVPMISQPVGLGFPLWVLVVSVTILIARSKQNDHE
jgi:hypothetical protein